MSGAHANIWTDSAELFREGFLESIDEQTSRLIVTGLEFCLPDGACRIADIGGGAGNQATLLAELGHSVTIVDLDPSMLRMAERRINALDPGPRRRLTLVEGTARAVREHAPYDVVCCHSVLMYEPDWRGLVRDLASILRAGGLLSVVCVNPEARAMRLGRQRRWREAIATISSGRQCDPTCIPGIDISRRDLESELRTVGIDPFVWYGVGVFEDGTTEESFAAEWLAGSTEPYRSVARSYHVIGRRSEA